jgi:tetratricopeptide (TPR) repeat protein
MGLAGTCFGLLLGWILGSQRATEPASQPAPAAQSSGASPSAATPPPAPIDEARVAELQQRAAAAPKDPAVRVELGDLYYDARRFDLAMPWYEAAFALQPANVNVSTDLAVCYFETSQIDRALAQLDTSLAIDPKHVKTLFNQGIFRASGKRDLRGAAESWEKVLQIAPNSEEARIAREALAAINSGHGTPPGGGGGARGGGAPPRSGGRP